MAELTSVINHSVMIAIFVFVMMLIVDYINVLTKSDMEKALKGRRRRQYAIASFLGATPGCLGAFMNVSFSFHHFWTRILGFRSFCQGKYDIDISDLCACRNIPFRSLKVPLKVREALQEARNMQAKLIIKAYAISLPRTNGCARILFVTQRGKTLIFRFGFPTVWAVTPHLLKLLVAERAINE